MKLDDYRKLLASASDATRRLNPAVVAALHTAEPEQAAAKTLDGGAQRKAAGAGRARVRLVIARRRLLDADNLCGGVKPLVDALRYAEYIRNDDPGSITLEVAQVKVKHAHEEGTLVEIAYDEND